eukprot:12929696-Prorocentrum_lima.AAC.1
MALRVVSGHMSPGLDRGAWQDEWWEFALLSSASQVGLILGADVNSSAPSNGASWCSMTWQGPTTGHPHTLLS